MNIRSVSTALALVLTLSAPAFAASGSSMNMDMDHAGHAAQASATSDMGSMNMNHSAQGMKADSKQVFTGTGTVVSVDNSAKKAVLAHDPIASLGWPSMTMGFAVEDASLLDGLKKGEKVRFDFRTEGNAAVIVDIEPLK